MSSGAQRPLAKPGACPKRGHFRNRPTVSRSPMQGTPHSPIPGKLRWGSGSIGCGSRSRFPNLRLCVWAGSGPAALPGGGRAGSPRVSRGVAGPLPAALPRRPPRPCSLPVPTGPAPARCPHRAPADERVGVRVAHEGPQLGQEGRDVAGPRRTGAHGQIHLGQGGNRRRERPRRGAEGRANAVAAPAVRAEPPPAAHTQPQGPAWPPPSCNGRAPAAAAAAAALSRPPPARARRPRPRPGPRPRRAPARVGPAPPPARQSGPGWAGRVLLRTRPCHCRKRLFGSRPARGGTWRVRGARGARRRQACGRRSGGRSPNWSLSPSQR